MTRPPTRIEGLVGEHVLRDVVLAGLRRGQSVKVTYLGPIEGGTEGIDTGEDGKPKMVECYVVEFETQVSLDQFAHVIGKPRTKTEKRDV